MRALFRPRPLLAFGLSFAAGFALLIAPWPDGNAAYSGFFQSLGNAVFQDRLSNRVVLFRPNDDPAAWPPNFDLLISVAARRSLRPAGDSPTIHIALDTRQLGWMPTALLVALILSTPVAWVRRGKALFLGLALLYLFILASAGFVIWNESSRLGLASLPPFWKSLADRLEDALLAPMGVIFLVPVLLWIALTFRREDARLLFQPN